MNRFALITSLTLVFGPLTSMAAPPAAKSIDPCAKIAEACKAAGFTKGDWKKGAGLWRDCVDPIVQGVKTVPRATKPLPIVDAATIGACKAKNPKFGGGKVGS